MNFSLEKSQLEPNFFPIWDLTTFFFLLQTSLKLQCSKKVISLVDYRFFSLLLTRVTLSIIAVDKKICWKFRPWVWSVVLHNFYPNKGDSKKSWTRNCSPLVFFLYCDVIYYPTVLNLTYLISRYKNNFGYKTQQTGAYKTY